MSTNEAAERLRDRLLMQSGHGPFAKETSDLLDAALAAERRATVERCVEWLAANEDGYAADRLAVAILDEEAVR